MNFFNKSNNKYKKNDIIIKNKLVNNEEIAINHTSTWYEFNNKSKNPNEFIAMKTDKGKGATFSSSIANAGGKSSQWWENFMKKFLSDNGAIIISSDNNELNEIYIFDFRSEIHKSKIVSKQRHFGFVKDGFFYYSFFTSLDLEKFEYDMEIILNSLNCFK